MSTQHMISLTVGSGLMAQVNRSGLTLYWMVKGNTSSALLKYREVSRGVDITARVSDTD